MTPRIVFSALFNESESYLQLYIENFRAFASDDCSLIVNLSTESEIEVNTGCFLDSRIYVHKSVVPRKKFGAGLLHGHIENFLVSKKIFTDFTYFCNVASNSLFVNQFDGSGVARHFVGTPSTAKHPIHEIPDGPWVHWKRIKESLSFLALVKECELNYLVKSQIEGFVTEAANWELIARRQAVIASRIHNNDSFPYEEILPASIIAQHGNDKYANICRVFWERSAGNEVGQVNMGDLIFPSTSIHSLMKTFNRDHHSPTTTAVTDKDFINLIEAMKRILNEETLSKTTMLRDVLSSTLDSIQLKIGSRLEAARYVVPSIARGTSFKFPVLKSRERISFEEQYLHEKSNQSFFIIAEPDGVGGEVELTLGDASGDNNGIIINFRSSVERGISDSSIIGYLYLKMNVADIKLEQLKIRVRADNHTHVSGAQRIVFNVGNRFSIMSRRHVARHKNEILVDLSVSDIISAARDSCYIGLPIGFGSRSRLQYHIEFRCRSGY